MTPALTPDITPDVFPEICQHIKLARSALSQGRTTAAIAAAQAGILLDPDSRDSEDLYRLLAWSYRRAGRPLPALWSDIKALMRSGRWTGSRSLEQDYRELVDLSQGQWLAAYRGLGLIFHEFGFWDGAIVAYQQALLIDPSNDSYLGIGDVWRDRTDGLANSDRAFAVYLLVLLRNPTSPETYQHLACLLRSIDRHDQALLCGRKLFPVELVEEQVVQAGRGRPWQWATVGEAGTGTTVQTIAPAQIVQLAASRSIEPEPHPDLQASSYAVKAAEVTMIDRGRVWADHFTSAIMTTDGALLTGLCVGSAEFIAASRHLPEPIARSGTGAVLSVGGGSMFCHWLLNVLSRLSLLEDAGWGIDRLDWLAVNTLHSKYHRQAIDLLGIPAAKLVASSPDHRHIQSDRLVVPTLVDRAPPWACDGLRRSFLKPAIVQTHHPVRRLYISRAWAKYRLVANDQAVTDLLGGQFGFNTVVLESFPLAQQISLVAQAEVIVGPHGAGLTHLVFCQPGTKVLELFSPRYVPSYFWELANLVHLDHYHLIGDPLDDRLDEAGLAAFSYIDPGAEGIWVDCDRLAATLRLMGL